MALFDNIPYFKGQKIEQLEQKEQELEKNIVILQQKNKEEIEKQRQLQSTINELTEKKNELDQMLKNRETFFIKTELKYIDTLDGWSFEKYCSDLFTKLGFTSIVTSGSGDYGGDILATYNNEQYVIQCKRYNEPISAKPIGEVLRSMKHYKCEKGVIVTNSTFTANAIEEAQDCDVELWDRNTLINYLGIAYKFDLSTIDLIKYGIYTTKDLQATPQILEKAKQEMLAKSYSKSVINLMKNGNFLYGDEFYFCNAVDFVVEKKQIDASILRQGLNFDYARTGRMMDRLTECGIISGFNDGKPRKVLMSKEKWEEMKKE